MIPAILLGITLAAALLLWMWIKFSAFITWAEELDQD